MNNEQPARSVNSVLPQTGRKPRRLFLLPGLLAIAIWLACSGCGTTKMVQLDKSFLEPLLVYPLNDVREDKTVALDGLCGVDQIKRPVSDVWMAKHKLCLVRYAGDTGLAQNVTIEDLQKVRRERLKLIPQNDERHVLFLYLTDLSTVGGGTYVKCALTGYLVDLSTGEVIWKNEVSTKEWKGILQGPLDSALFSSSASSPACKRYGQTLTQLLDTLPILEKSSSASAPPPKSQ